MNWSHALLVVAIASGAFFVLGIIAATKTTIKEDLREVAGGFLTLLVITVISGALAAGLWH